MLSKTTKVYDELKKYHGLIIKGTVLCIDPSIGSSSSMPGWAVSRNGTRVDSGIIEIEVSRDIPARLQVLNRKIRNLIQEWDPDILVYEDIPAQRHGGGNANAHASLLKALGAILSVPGPRGYVGLHPMTWKRLARPSYVKGDEEDANEMLWISIELSKWMETEVEKKGKKKR